MLDNVTYKEIFPAVKITTRLTRLSLDKKSRSGRSHQIKLSLSLGKKKILQLVRKLRGVSDFGFVDINLYSWLVPLVMTVNKWTQVNMRMRGMICMVFLASAGLHHAHEIVEGVVHVLGAWSGVGAGPSARGEKEWLIIKSSWFVSNLKKKDILLMRYSILRAI